MRDSNSLRCLLDDDAEAVGTARRRKLRSLVISVSMQVLFLTAVIVLPMLATGKMPLQTQPPVIVFRGRPAPYEAPARDPGSRSSSTRPRFVPTDRVLAPVRFPDRAEVIVDGPPEIGRGNDQPTCPGCRPDGVMNPPFSIPSGSGPAPPMPEVRPTPTAKPLLVSRSIQEAKVIHRVDPVYPPLCRQMRLEGELVLRAIIGRDGAMTELTYVRGPACFVQNAMNAVAQWRYRPTILNGQPVEVETTITVIYHFR